MYSFQEQVERWEDREGAKRAAYRFSLALVKKDKWYKNLLNALHRTGNSSLAYEIEGVSQDNETNESQEDRKEGGGNGSGGGGRDSRVGERPGGSRHGPVDEGTKRTMHHQDTDNPRDFRLSSKGKCRYM